MFHDHFSRHAEDYRKHRPGYPEILFATLAVLAPARRVAWDCGTGSGQVAVPLARHFEHVHASDASAAQIEQAPRLGNITYRVERAEASSLPEGTVDLIAVASAYHWLDQLAFEREALRLLVPGGILATWSYGPSAVTPQVDGVLQGFREGFLAPYWPPEAVDPTRKHPAFGAPFHRVDAPNFQIEHMWTADELFGYVTTWSAYRRAVALEEAKAHTDQLRHALAATWGSDERRSVRWSIELQVLRRDAA